MRRACALLVMLAVLDGTGTGGVHGSDTPAMRWAIRSESVRLVCSPTASAPAARTVRRGRLAALRGGACYSSASSATDDDDGEYEEESDDAPLRTDWERRILVTGGCGFMGSYLVDRLVSRYDDYLIVVLDVLDECGSLEHLRGALDRPNCVFVRGDVSLPICTVLLVSKVSRERARALSLTRVDVHRSGTSGPSPSS